MTNDATQAGQHDESGPLDRKDMSNERFRSLVLRGQRASDTAASDELSRYLLSKAYWLLREYPSQRRAEVVGRMLEAGVKAARRAVCDMVIKQPRAYTVTAMKNALIDQLRSDGPRGLWESLEDFAERPRVDPRLDHDRRRIETRMLLENFLERSRTEQDRRMAKVLLVMFLDGCEVRQACALLGYEQKDTEAVCKKIQRDRANPKSRLAQLIRDLRQDPTAQE